MKKLILLTAVAFALFSCGNNPNPPEPDPVVELTREDVLGTYTYNISGTATVNLTVVGNMDIPVNLDGEFEITADSESEDGIIVTSSDFETTGRVTKEGVQFDNITRVSDTTDEYGDSHIEVEVVSQLASFKDNALNWDATANAIVAMTVMGANVDGSGSGAVHCTATKQ